MIRKRICGEAVFLMAFMMTNVVLASKEEIPTISADTMLRLNSVVGVWRSPSPKWSPDGIQIIFSSILNEGGAVCIRPEGGCPIRVPIADQGAGPIEYICPA